MAPVMELVEKATEEKTILVCSHCVGDIKVENPHEGKSVKCPHCGLNWIVSFIPGMGYELFPEDNVWVLE
ncbi:MAG TPA: hypothetical protein EYO62_04375 [Aquificales bacterium]|nr:hypothetical protein [Aquificales bacterium]